MRFTSSVVMWLSVAVVLLSVGAFVSASLQERHTARTGTIPASVQTEHTAIHSALDDATKSAGAVGVAARELAEVLHPHFVREEEIALPPLGLLTVLANGAQVPAEADGILVMTDALGREMPRMLQEHTRIRAAVDNLRRIAREAGATRELHLADQLALHAQTEEEVLYPAAILVGEVIRARRRVNW